MRRAHVLQARLTSIQAATALTSDAAVVRVRVTAVAKGPQVPAAGEGHMQSAIRHVV